MDGTSANVDDVAQRLDQLSRRIAQVEDAMAQQARDPELRVMFSGLHSALLECRSEAVRATQRPILNGLILLYDAALRMAVSDASPAVRELAEEMIELLHRHGVEPITERPERFDHRIQKAVRSEAAATPEDDQRVVQVVRHGFRWEGRVLRPQEVVVKVWKNG